MYPANTIYCTICGFPLEDGVLITEAPSLLAWINNCRILSVWWMFAWLTIHCRRFVLGEQSWIGMSEAASREALALPGLLRCKPRFNGDCHGGYVEISRFWHPLRESFEFYAVPLLIVELQSWFGD